LKPPTAGRLSAAVSVDGKMPQHIHGLPTRPQVQRAEQGTLVERHEVSADRPVAGGGGEAEHRQAVVEQCRRRVGPKRRQRPGTPAFARGEGATLAWLPYSARPILRPAGRTHLDIDALSANPLAHRATRVRYWPRQGGRSWRTSFLQRIVKCSIA
jgi:hypothetical protein